MTRMMLSAVCLAAASCGVDSSALSLSVSPSIRANGDSTTLTVSAIGADGKPGTGSVTLAARVGVLKATTLTLTAGEATTTYSCSAGCGDGTTLTATWSSAGGRTISAELSLRFISPKADAGVQDAGGADSGTPDSGVDAGVPDASALEVFSPGPVVMYGSVDPAGHLGFQNLGGEPLGYGLTSVPDQLVLNQTQLLYRTGHSVFRVVADSLDFDDAGALQFPPSPEGNDVAVSTSSCDGGITRFSAGFADELWFVCLDGTVRLTPGNLVYPLSSGDQFIAGGNGVAMLRRDGGILLRNSAGLFTPAPLPAKLGAVRPTSTGFDFSYELDGGVCRLGRTTSAGVFTDVAAFAGVSAQYERTASACLEAQLNADGISALWVTQVVASQVWVVVRRGLLPEGTTPAHSASTVPSDFSTSPPSVRIQSAPGFGVVARP